MVLYLHLLKMSIFIKMRVKEILKKKGITSKELAERLGMTETGLSIAIGDKGNPPLKRLQEIASALGVPITELFEQPQDNVFTCPKCGTSLTVKEN